MIEALPGHLEHPELAGRSEAVFERPENPQPQSLARRRTTSTRVDEVLEHPRPGERAVFGDLADDARWRTRARAPRPRGGANTGAPGATEPGAEREIGVEDGLDRVDDRQLGSQVRRDRRAPPLMLQSPPTCTPSPVQSETGGTEPETCWGDSSAEIDNATP